jgi:hypothetical protein
LEILKYALRAVACLSMLSLVVAVVLAGAGVLSSSGALRWEIWGLLLLLWLVGAMGLCDGTGGLLLLLLWLARMVGVM